MKRPALVIVAVLAAVGGGTAAWTASLGGPAVLESQVERIRFDMPALAPIAYTRFCVKLPDECRVRHMAFRRSQLEAPNSRRLQDLIEVNRNVNRAIAPRSTEPGVLAEQWRLSPKAGACHDFAVTKRHELLARGWASRSLLLAEVAVPSGKHHLVLVARTAAGDFVLDNLVADIRSWSRTPYRWLRIQLPLNPNLWSTIAPATV